MARRLKKTLADYVVIALSPVLIIGLVAALVFFLLGVFYRGGYPGRMHWILGLFVIATVLIARIAIEEGKERAALFSVALALATGMTVMKFSDMSFVLNGVFLAIIWWCANKLTWDATVIDEREDASGEGLMQLVGMEKPPVRERNVDDDLLDVDKKENDAPDAENHTDVSWRDRIRGSKGRPHAPGVWVVYFSLAALPLFGFLHRFLPADPASRKAAFGYVFLYVGCALGLLVTTSFLGLRRYLRQRQLEMSSPMTITWISVGAGMILVLLLAATILPRPNAEFAALKPPFDFESSKDLIASKWGWGREGIQEDDAQQKGQAPKGGKAAQKSKQNDSGGKEGGGKQQGGKQQGGKQQGGKQQGGKQQGGKQQGGKQQGGKQQGGKQQGGKQQGEKQPGGKQQGDEQRERTPQENTRQPPQKNDESNQNRSEQDRSPSEQQQDSRRQESAQQPQGPQESLLRKVSGGIGWLVKLVFYLALAVVGAWLLWKYHRELIQAARELWRDFLKFLSTLFGRKPLVEKVEPAETVPVKRPPAFATFVDPFSSGRSARMKPEQLLDYSFSAFEAWAYERGLPRGAEQTPLEFARLAGRRVERVAGEARYLAELYSQAAYSSATTAAAATEKLRALWWIMTDESV